MKSRYTASALVLLLSLVGSAAVHAELKIGFVNAARVLEEAPQAAAARESLQQEFDPRDRELVAMQKEIKGFEERLARDAAVMSEAEQRKVERDLIARKRELKRNQDVFREDFNIRRNEELGKLQRLVVQTIRGIAEKERYDLMLTDGVGVLYASKAVDITEQVLQLLKDRPSGGKSGGR